MSLAVDVALLNGGVAVEKLEVMPVLKVVSFDEEVVTPDDVCSGLKLKVWELLLPVGFAVGPPPVPVPEQEIPPDSPPHV